MTVYFTLRYYPQYSVGSPPTMCIVTDVFQKNHPTMYYGSYSWVGNSLFTKYYFLQPVTLPLGTKSSHKLTLFITCISLRKPPLILTALIFITVISAVICTITKRPCWETAIVGPTMLPARWTCSRIFCSQDKIKGISKHAKQVFVFSKIESKP